MPLDPDYPAERLAFILEDAGVRLVLTQQSILDSKLRYADAVCLDSDRDLIEQESLDNPISSTQSDNLAYAIYTSGSTGKPKGTLIEHKSVVNYLLWINQALFEGAIESLPAITATSFDASLKQVFGRLITERAYGYFLKMMSLSRMF